MNASRFKTWCVPLVFAVACFLALLCSHAAGTLCQAGSDVADDEAATIFGGTCATYMFTTKCNSDPGTCPSVSGFKYFGWGQAHETDRLSCGTTPAGIECGTYAVDAEPGCY